MVLERKMKTKEGMKKEKIKTEIESMAYKHGMDPLLPSSWYSLSKVIKHANVSYYIVGNYIINNCKNADGTQTC